jgi:NADPH:quinone reductase-like Zn-dependent oxidoreductase
LKALRFNQTGDFNFLQYVDFPMPILGVDEVLIEVKAARLNRNDLSNVMGRLPYTTLPRTPGRDYAGIIVDGPVELIGHDVWGTGKENGFVRDGSGLVCGFADTAELWPHHHHWLSPSPCAEPAAAACL